MRILRKRIRFLMLAFRVTIKLSAGTGLTPNLQPTMR